MCVHMCTRVLMLHAYTCASWPMQRRYAVAKQSHAVCCCLCVQCLGVSVSKLGARCAGEACCEVLFGMDAPEPRRFRHIHWHRGLKRWVAQLRGGRGGTLDSGLCQDALARKLAAQLGVRVATLTLTPRAEKKNSKYKYVYWKRVSATRECWQGLVKGTYLGVFRTELLAAKAVARHLGVPVVELQKSPASYFLRDVVLRFRATRIYWAPGVFIPPDLEAAVQHQTVSKAMYNAEAAYEILSVQGKYGPWKHALFKAWTANGRPSSRGLPPQARADNVVAVLRSACEFMHGHNLTAWVQHCGRGVTHHSGFVPMLLRMQVIRRAASGPLHLGLSKYAFTCRRSVQVSRCLQGLLLACDKLRGVLASPPRTCQQWRRLYGEYCAVLRDAGVPRMGLSPSAKYLLPWTFRVQCIARMRAAGIQHLRAGKTPPSLEEFADMFPDQGSWVTKLAKLLPEGQRTVSRLTQTLEYTGPLELFTMYLCFSQDRLARRLAVAQRPEAEEAARGCIIEHRRVHGMAPHPAMLFNIIAGRQK